MAERTFWETVEFTSGQVVEKLKELVDSGELGEILYVYGNRVNLGTIRRDENALR